MFERTEWRDTPLRSSIFRAGVRWVGQTGLWNWLTFIAAVVTFPYFCTEMVPMHVPLKAPFCWKSQNDLRKHMAISSIWFPIVMCTYMLKVRGLPFPHIAPSQRRRVQSVTEHVNECLRQCLKQCLKSTYTTVLAWFPKSHLALYTSFFFLVQKEYIINTIIEECYVIHWLNGERSMKFLPSRALRAMKPAAAFASRQTCGIWDSGK